MNNYNSFRLPSYIPYDSGYGLGTGGTNQPPPLPPRATNMNLNYNRYGGYGGNYGGYGGFGGYGSYGSYGNYGGFGMGYRPYGNDPNYENSFIQIAEESARPAFDSIRSIVNLMASVTSMFDSTFQAIHSSYLSVISLADSYSRLKSMLGRILSTFALIRGLNWLYRKLLYSLGLSATNPSVDGAWAEAVNKIAVTNENVKRSNLSTAMLMGIIVAGPYLVYKLISELHPPKVKWDPTKQIGQPMTTLYNFNSGMSNELSFVQNECLIIAPKEFQPSDSGWALACNQRGQTGLVPLNYLAAQSTVQNTVTKVAPPNPSAPNYLDNVTGLLPQDIKNPKSDVKPN